MLLYYELSIFQQSSIAMIKRTESLIENNHCSRLKDLPYFKEVLKNYDLAIIKQFILQHVLPIRILQHQQYNVSLEYRYIPHQNATIMVEKSQRDVQIKEGVPLEEMEGIIIAKEDLTLYSISLKTELILTKLNSLQLPILFDLKSCQKLMFLAKCQVSLNNFGSYIFRKGEAVEALFFLIEGQVKIYKKVNEKAIELGTVEKDRMFGLYCLKHDKSIRQLSAKASQNNTQVLIVWKEHLEQLCEQRQTTLARLLENYKSELHSFIKAWSIPKRQTASKEDIRKAELTLEKRVRGYHRQNNIRSKEIQKLIKTKSLLFKVRDLNLSIKKESQLTLKRYAFDFSTSSIRRRKITNNAMRYTQATTTPQQTPFCTPIIRSFVGLTKSASVRQYISNISRRE